MWKNKKMTPSRLRTAKKERIATAAKNLQKKIDATKEEE